MSYTIGFRGDQHLGYKPTGMRLNPVTALSQRITDGIYAHEATMQSMLDAGVDGIVDGGDQFHWHRPDASVIEVANRVDDMRVAAGVWAIVNSGNHDAGAGNDIAATGVMHRPTLGISAVYPDIHRGPNDGVGPFPGLYEIHTSETNKALPDSVAIHVVSHHGLSRDLEQHGVAIDPTPLPGYVNLFTSHGVFHADERLYQCADPHGEERPIPGEWALRGWDAMILSHYHTLGPVPGYGEGDRGQVWYTGSSLRRGFSDEACARGWVKVDIHDTGNVTVTAQPIWQRPQHDLPTIDATGLTVNELDELITANLAAVSHHDPESERLTGDGGAIIRQVVTGSTPTQRQGLTGLRGRFATLSEDASWWGLDTMRNATSRPKQGDRNRRELRARVTQFGDELRTRADQLTHAAAVPQRLREPALGQATSWADQIVVDTEVGENFTMPAEWGAAVDAGSSPDGADSVNCREGEDREPPEAVPA